MSLSNLIKVLTCVYRRNRGNAFPASEFEADDQEKK